MTGSLSSFFSQFWSSALRGKPPLGQYSPDVNLANPGSGLVRRLGPFDLLLINIGASIGSGIFVVTGTVARDAGPGVTISFLLAGASCALNALCFAELATRFPAVLGGVYMYTYTTFNELTAFLVFAQLTLDGHIGVASIARSLASYIINIFELIPSLKDNIPNWVGHGTDDIFGFMSINILAPIILLLLTIILCCRVRESTLLNTIMTTTKVTIILVVIFVGSFEVDASNWSPFAPNGVKPILTGAPVAFWAYVGFDAVANLAEESKRPQRDLPISIIGSLIICLVLYMGVCLVITGMVPYNLIGEDAPLADAFKSKGLNSVSALISIGAIVGLTTSLLVSLYTQSRGYVAIGRDGLLPAIFSKIHPTLHTPVHSQIWVGVVNAILAGLFNVDLLSHILSVGTLTCYSIGAACVITLRWDNDDDDNDDGDVDTKVSIVSRKKGNTCIAVIACCGFGAGILYRYSGSTLAYTFIILPIVIAVLAVAYLQLGHVYKDPPGFSCPWVPLVPAVCIFFNIFLFAQLHYEGWVRFVILNIVACFVYAFYGQHNANHAPGDTIYYHKLPSSLSVP